MKLTIETGRENRILRTKSGLLTQTNYREYLSTIREMLEWLKKKGDGAGLSAPQIGINKRFAVVNLYAEDEKGDLAILRTIPLINPVVLEHSSESGADEEGCFSVPGEYGDVERWNWIVLEYRDERFLKRKIRLEWFSARVVLHEIDHLDGILFIDKVIRMRKKLEM